MADAIEKSLEKCIELMRVHAEAVRSGESEEKIRKLADELDAADDDYRDAIYDKASFADPFNIGIEDEDAGDEEESLTPAVEGELQLSLNAQFEFVVNDGATFCKYVQSRMAEESPDVDASDLEDHAGIPVAALDALFAIDGFRSDKYTEYGLIGEAAEWHVRAL